MKKLVLIGATGLVLAACAPQVPPAGVGFSDYGQYEIERAQREAALTGVQPAAPYGAAMTGGGTAVAGSIPVPGGISSTELAAAGIGAGTQGTLTSGAATPGAPLANSGLLAAGGQGPAPTSAEPFFYDGTGSRISDEQSFDAVAGRETIESDAERRARQAAAYQEVQPTALPQRSDETGPNIVAYALNAPNAKGQEYYSRFILSGQNRFQRNCASYRSADEAQRDFLARGGPERDPRGIDPDGDGFACGWDPAPFRAAVSAN